MTADWLKKIKSLYQHKVIVLMYHRIADLKTDPWSLAVKLEHFEQHLQILKEYRVISVSQLVAQLQNKSITSNCICITFDDAYSDNYLFAKPLLEKYQYPATFFVPTNYIDQNKPFWWDELENILLNSQRLPNSLSIWLGKELCTYQIENKELSPKQLQKCNDWRWPNKPPNQRCELYLEIWGKLKCLPYQDIQVAIEYLRRWSVLPETDNQAQLPMNNLLLQKMMDHTLFEVGVHTATHPALSCYSFETQLEEIDNSRNYLQNKTNKFVNTIAYPYGNYNEATIKAVKEQKLLAAFTTQPKLVTKNSNIYQLGRFQVGNWNGEIFKNKLSSWFKQG